MNEIRSQSKILGTTLVPLAFGPILTDKLGIDIPLTCAAATHTPKDNSRVAIVIAHHRHRPKVCCIWKFSSL